jgi:eukaryotic-like serine/threonine-protein kinase
MGTAGYMSPEQVRKEKLDARSDLFSFGLVLYEAAVGRRAFTGETSETIRDAILHETPARARDLNSSVPRGLDAVISRALEKERALRYQSSAEMCKELERVRRETQPWRRQARNWATVGALLMLLAVGLGIYWRSRNRVSLSRNDTIVLAVDNQTGDPVFNDALYTSLRTGLEQTPYLACWGLPKWARCSARFTSLRIQPG